MMLARTVSEVPSIGGDGSYPGLVPNLSGNAFAIDICPIKKYMVCRFARAVIRNSYGLGGSNSRNLFSLRPEVEDRGVSRVFLFCLLIFC